MKASELVQKMIEIRELKRQLDSAYRAKKSKLDAADTRLRNAMLEHMNKQGVSSIRYETGTVFTSVTRKVNTDDINEFMDFVRETGNVDLLERRPKKSEVLALLDAGEKVPGVSQASERSLRVKLPTSE